MKGATRGTMAVVVIEDDDETRRLLTFLFESNGYQVFQAGTGQEGLVLSKLHKPQVITLDLRLPDMMGVDVLSALKSDRATEGIPVIVVSGSTSLMSTSDRKRSFKVVHKPFDLSEIEAAVALAVRNGGNGSLALPQVG